MVFNSFEFAVFLPLVFILYWTVFDASSEVGVGMGNLSLLLQVLAGFSLGADPVGSSIEEFTAFVRRDTEKYAKIVKISGAKID